MSFLHNNWHYTLDKVRVAVNVPFPYSAVEHKVTRMEHCLHFHTLCSSAKRKEKQTDKPKKVRQTEW